MNYPPNVEIDGKLNEILKDVARSVESIDQCLFIESICGVGKAAHRPEAKMAAFLVASASLGGSDCLGRLVEHSLAWAVSEWARIQAEKKG